MRIRTLVAKPKRTFAYLGRFLFALLHGLVPVMEPDDVPAIMLTHMAIATLTVFIDIGAHTKVSKQAEDLEHLHEPHGDGTEMSVQKVCDYFFILVVDVWCW